jgi:formyl-CoA transferase
VSRGGGPLAGVRVIELGALLAGPFAGQLLADLGAEVVKVEAPDRLDPMREWGHEHYNGRSLWWPLISRNKKLVTINLREPQGRSLLLDLVRDSDAVVENFRPGTLERWDLGFEQLRQANPKIVLVRVSGYGQTGPYADRPGFAAAAEAISGLRYINGHPGEVPPRVGISLGDSVAGMFAAHGLLAALYHRDALGGEGQVVDVSILESCFALLESTAPEYDRLGRVREPSGTRLPGVSPSNVFRSRDGELVVIAANHDALFERLCEAMDRTDLANDPRYASHRARCDNQDALEAEIEAWAGERTAAEIDSALASSGVVCGRVNSIAHAFADPHIRAREMLVRHEDPEVGAFFGPGVIPRFSQTPGAIRWSGRWQPGHDNREVLGRSDEALARLREEGIV